MGLPKKFLNDFFAFAIRSLTEMAEAQVPFLIQNIFCGPATVGEKLPEFEVAIQNNWVGDAELVDGAFDVRLVLGKSELRCMHSDHSESQVHILLVPLLDVGQSANAVDAGVVPEIHEDDTTAQLAEAQRRRIQPDAPNFRCTYFAFVNLHAPCFSR